MPKGSGTDEIEGQSGVIRAALFGLCPRCEASTLFEAPARVSISCRACSLPLAELERGGRLAGLVTILVAAVLIGLAMVVDIYLQPPLWLQALIWAPVTIASVIFTLRFYKTALLYRQYEVWMERQQGSE